MKRAFEPGYFGKLPLAADFLSRHAGDPEALALERWLQEGVQLARLRFGPAADGKLLGFPPHRFVFWTGD
ncbi:MAG: TagF domain-containing protein, partial [Candidatus Eisenbacteria bacterium]|nr:TagF domain-containing protein [Candidatus Eisenbacteria bacterium]